MRYVCNSLNNSTDFWRMPMSFTKCLILHLLQSYRICVSPTEQCLPLLPIPSHLRHQLRAHTLKCNHKSYLQRIISYLLVCSLFLSYASSLIAALDKMYLIMLVLCFFWQNIYLNNDWFIFSICIILQESSTFLWILTADCLSKFPVII